MLVLEGVLLLAFLAVGAYAAAERGLGLEAPFRLNEGHHAYVGALLVLVGLVGDWAGFAFQAIGVLLTVDDLGQHFIQTFSDDDYRSPLHRFYARYLWPLWWVQRLTRWWDEVFA